MKTQLLLKILAIISILMCAALGGCDNAKNLSVTDSNCKLANGQLLLGNNNYLAISYSGDRAVERTVHNSPTVKDIKEDMKLLSAMGIKLL